MTELLGQRIGHIRVIDILGKGGMGEVYVGFDDTLERKVALKSIRAEQKLNDVAKARFLREARVLSQLAHPNICQIYDYIDREDADLLVLELIRGKSLNKAIKEGLDDQQRLKIAQQVARVLIAAHERNVVHRDLKPDNVMLTDEGEVKVLDFGLSRSTIEETQALGIAQSADTLRVTDDVSAGEPRKSSSSSVTIHGAIMGTPGYMSPEQAGGEVATPASDMYAFGLLLQELFTGKKPYETGLSVMEVIRRTHEGISLPVEGIDHDLTALINRLKSKAPASRPSAVDTLERIQWIIDKPLRRRKRALTVAAIVILSLSSIVMTIQTIRATRAEKAAKREADVAKSVTTFLVDLFDISDPYQKKSGEKVTAREILDKGAARIGRELQGQPEIEARMMSTIGTVYRKLGLFDQAKSQLEAARALIEKSHKPDDPEVADVLYAVASLDSDQGNYTEADALFKRSLDVREKLLGRDHADVADVLNNLATLDAREGKFNEARPLLERSLAIREKRFGPDALIVADALNNLALLHSIQGHAERAEELYQRSLRIREKALGPNHPRVADSLNNLSVEYMDTGRIADAEPLAARALAIFERSLGPEHPHVAHCLNNLAEIRQLQGKYADAEPLYRRSLAIYEKTSGPEHPDVAYELTYLGKLYVDEKHPEKAEPLLRRALAVYEKAVGAHHPDTAHALFNLAALESSRGNKPRALEYLKRSFQAGAQGKWPQSMETDAAFTSLRGTPEFQQLLAQAKNGDQ